MRIAIFGDSHSHGIFKIENGTSWVDVLADMQPTWEIDNYSIPGSNLQMQLFLYENVKKRYPAYYDKVLFQLPDTVERFTYFLHNQDFLQKDRIQNKNVTKYDYWQISKNVQFISEGLLTKVSKNNWRWKLDVHKRRFAELYYQKTNKEILSTEIDIITQYIMTNINLGFYIWGRDDIEKDNIPIIKEMVSSEKWNSWTNQDGIHCNKDGQYYIANWILGELL